MCDIPAINFQLQSRVIANHCRRWVYAHRINSDTLIKVEISQDRADKQQNNYFNAKKVHSFVFLVVKSSAIWKPEKTIEITRNTSSDGLVDEYNYIAVIAHNKSVLNSTINRFLISFIMFIVYIFLSKAP